ncbi:MAG: PEGA domain-containing protein [Alphaproteobacteria bacterium]|nr:PEGA domain-containing protein [Alphaproteobacteria bacterium]
MKSVYFIPVLFLAACAQSTYSESAPSWVNSLRSGNSTLKIISGDKVLFRSNFKSDKISDREELCNLSVEQNEKFIRKTYPHSRTIPMTVELRYYDPKVKDCSTTISVPRSFTDGENDSDKKLVGVQGENTGILNLTTIPTAQADVYIDDMPFSQSNSNIKIALTAGKHTLKIDHRNYEQFEQKITIPVKGETPVSAKLVPAKVNVTVNVLNSDIKADVFVNDVYKGKTPLTVPAEINQDNVFTLKHDEFLENSVTLKASDMRRGDNVKLNNIVLTEKPSYISFTTDPAGAEVFIDSKKAGTTPLEKYEISRGFHRYEVFKNGFFTAKGEINAVGGNSISKNLRLTRDADLQFTVLDTPEQQQSKSAPVAAKKKEAIDIVLRDKYHTYEFKENPVTLPLMPNAATREDIIMALMRWDYPDQLIRASASYNKNGEFFLKISLDEETYRQTVYNKILMILKKIPKKSDACFVKKERVWTGKYDNNNYKIYETKVTKNCREGIELAKSTTSSDTKDFNIQLLSDKPYFSVSNVLKRKIKITAELENGHKKFFFVPFSVQKFKVDKERISFVPVFDIVKKDFTVIKKTKNSVLIMKKINTSDIKSIKLTVETDKD